MYKLLSWFASKSFLPDIKDKETEQNKVNFIRIFLAAVVLSRNFIATYSAYYYLGNVSWFGVVVVILNIGLLFGTFTPFVLFLNIVLCNHFDHAFGMGTLGTSMLTLAYVMLLLMNTGMRFSFDEYMERMQPGSMISRINRKLYSIIGFPDEKGIKSVYFLMFAIYGLTSFGAILLHISDYYWTNGYTARVLFVNSYLCPYYKFFRSIESDWHTALVIFSTGSSIFQSVFQLLMIPLMFTRIGKWFVIIWGINFFLFSYFALQLSYLPQIELCMWFCIFYRGNSTKKIRILYDDYCNLCKRTITFLSYTDLFHRLEYVPLSTNKDLISEYSLDRFAVQENIHGIYDAKVYVGYDMYILASKKCFLLWVLYPVFLFGKISGIGPKIYGFFALNRVKLFGTCEVAFYPTPYEIFKIYTKQSAGILFKPLVRLFCLFFALFCCLIPHSEGFSASVVGSKNTDLAKYLLYFAGFQIPDVFNWGDLSMGDKWYVMYKSDRSQKPKQLVPLNGLNGERLKYHKSDVLYFGNSLKYRRGLINHDPRTMHDTTDVMFYLIRSMTRFDYRYCGYKDTVDYDFTVLQTQASIIQAPIETKYNPQVVLKGKFKMFRCRIIDYELE